MGKFQDGRKLPRKLTERERELLLAAESMSKECRLILQILDCTGCQFRALVELRRGEAMRALIHGDGLEIAGEKYKISDELLEKLLIGNTDSPYCFPHRKDRHKPRTHQGVQIALKRAAIRCGITDLDGLCAGSFRKFGAHNFYSFRGKGGA